MPDPLPAPAITFHRAGPLLAAGEADDTKDPCPVFDGKQWHIYGSKGSNDVLVGILHATAPTPNGPWKFEENAITHGIKNPHACAPGVIFDKGMFHMFLQTDYDQLGSRIEYLRSEDGKNFFLVNTALEPIPNGREAGIYDSHPALIDGKCYFVYSGFPKVGHGDIYLAESSTNTWEGPWKRLGTILTHEEVPFHNQHENPDYEWGLEGAQLAQLPSGIILLTAVCFLPEGKRGYRQRVFLALASNILGPYKTIGPILNPSSEEWEAAENGHATTLVDNNNLRIFYQGRNLKGYWRYGVAEAKTQDLEAIAKEVLAKT